MLTGKVNPEFIQLLSIFKQNGLRELENPASKKLSHLNPLSILLFSLIEAGFP